MTTSDSRVSDEMLNAAIEAHDAECIRGAYDDTWKAGELIRSSMRAALEAALSAQAPSVAVVELEAIICNVAFINNRTGQRILEDLRNLISKAGRDE